MKKLFIPILTLFVFSAVSCGSSSDTTQQKTNPHAEAHMNLHQEFYKEQHLKEMEKRLSENMHGTYLGMLPCDDCEKIIYRLQLNKDKTYQAKITYQGKDVAPVTKEGTYSLTGDFKVHLEGMPNELGYLLPQDYGFLVLNSNGEPVKGADATAYALLPATRQADNPRHDRFVKILQDKAQKGIDFYAFGNEPFWSLDIDFEKDITFKQPQGEAFTAKTGKAEKAMDAPVERYRSVTDKGEIIVEIHKKPCSDNMAGDKYDYSVTIELKLTGDTGYRSFHGCGVYIPDYRLHDIWAIREVEGEKIDPAGFKEAPRLEINLTSGKIMGSDGCNAFNGKVVAERNTLSIGNLAQTMRACAKNAAISDKIGKNLSGKTLSYRFEDGYLNLYDNNKKVLALKHID